MRLQSIELLNFRQFKNVKVDFAIGKTDDKNVTLIMGDNGSGKTCLAQAFTWCLYGKHNFQDKVLLNRDVANNMLPLYSEKVRVKLTLEHEQLEYSVIRELEYTKQNDDKLKKGDDILAISKKDADGNKSWLGSGTTSAANKIILESAINDIIPQDLLRYFFFDGEKIETLSKEISSGKKSNNFVEAVNCLTGLKSVKLAMGHLNPSSRTSVIGKLDEEYISGSDTKLKSLSEVINTDKGKLENVQNQIKQINDNISKNNEYIDELEQKIKTYAEAKKLQEEKEQYEKKVEEYKWQQYQKLSIIYDEFNRDDALERFFCEWPVSEALKILTNCDVSGKDIPKLHGDTIKYLLKRGTCICGTPLCEHSEANKTLIDLINFLPPESIAVTIGNFVKSTKNKYQDKSDMLKRIKSHYDNIDELNSKVSDCEENIINIKKKLGSNDVSSEVRRLQNNIVSTKNAITILRTKKSGLDKMVGALEESIKRNTKEQGLLASKSSDNRRIELTKKYANELYNMFCKEYAAKEKDTKEKLEKYININFNKFFAGRLRLQIDDRYAVRVSVNDKFNSLETSTAQGIAVIFAFLAAIIKLAKENTSTVESQGIGYVEAYPIVMDAPLSTLDEQRIKIVCETLPLIADQVIIFIKDTDGKVAENYLGAKIGKQLNFNKISDYDTRIE